MNFKIMCYKALMKKGQKDIQFGKRLAEIRKARGLTQKVLGEKIGVTQRVIAYYEGETNYPPAMLLPKIAKVLNISIDELFSNKKIKDASPETQNILKKLRKIEKMPPKQRQLVLDIIDKAAKSA